MLAVLQIAVLLFSLAVPTGTALATDPSSDPSASPTESPSTSPSDTPAPSPSDTPAPTEPPAPTPAPTDTPAPSATPTPPPASNPVPYIVTFTAGSTALEQQAALTAAHATVESTVPELRMVFVSVPAATAVDDFISLQASPAVVGLEADKTRAAEGTPNDSSYADQWSLPKIGWDQLYGTATPSGSSTVALLDTGVDGSQADLAGSLVAGTSVLDGSNGLTDANGHGTWMAGIVAAQTNNGSGVAGVGFAGVRVMPVTVLGADGTGQDSDIIAGVVYAADHNANVILMAFSNPAFSPALQAAIDYAWAHGAVLVAAAGNDGSDVATFPAGDRG
ncbi:MAG: hypothetical protein E6I62_09245, partial [Chloroflexi bacterium]